MQQPKWKSSLVSWLIVFWSSKSCSSVNICPIFKNEMSKPKSEPYLSKTQEILKIKQKAFVLLLIKRRTFFGTPGRFHGIRVKDPVDM